MITLDAIRTALLASDPYTQMDRIVRAEMSAGRKVKDIFNTINPLIDAALDTPDLPEDGEEALLGTIDALTGMCRADQCYKDPPNVTIPATESRGGTTAGNEIRPVG